MLPFFTCVELDSYVHLESLVLFLSLIGCLTALVKTASVSRTVILLSRKIEAGVDVAFIIAQH